jgi:hypothetical protein
MGCLPMSRSKAATADPPLGFTELKVWACRCRCGHLWVPREWLKQIADAGGVCPQPNQLEKPRVCPECKSANWDRPKLYERKQVTPAT